MPKKKTLNEFIDEANRIHNYIYNYDKTIYINAKTKVIVTCKKHGDFKIKPMNHTTSKQGCAECSGNVALTTDTFIDKSNIKHNFKYSYNNLNYTNSHDIVTITCPIHGDFEQKAYSHLAGHGCNNCGNEEASLKNQEKKDIWSHRGWEESGNKSKQFSAYSIYIIRCWNDNESFIKIGKTFMNMKRRFSSKKSMPYEWELIKLYTGSANFINNLELHIHNSIEKHKKFDPSIKFNGSKECYKQLEIEEIEEIKKLYISKKIKDIKQDE